MPEEAKTQETSIITVLNDGETFSGPGYLYEVVHPENECFNDADEYEKLRVWQIKVGTAPDGRPQPYLHMLTPEELAKFE